MLNALKINLKAFARKETSIPADQNQTLTQIERNMRKQGGGGALKRAAAPCFGMEGSICVFDFYLREWGFPFERKALRFIFKAFSIRFVYTCSLHVPFMFPCPPTLPPTPPTHPPTHRPTYPPTHPTHPPHSPTPPHPPTHLPTPPHPTPPHPTPPHPTPPHPTPPHPTPPLPTPPTPCFAPTFPPWQFLSKRILSIAHVIKDVTHQ